MNNSFNDDEIKNLTENLTENNVKKFANSHLNAKQQQQLNDILSDKNRLQSLLNSPKAQEIMRKLGGNNGK